jgi:hypothetical protein
LIVEGEGGLEFPPGRIELLGGEQVLAVAGVGASALGRLGHRGVELRLGLGHVALGEQEAAQ